MPQGSIRIGTRGSPLALAQAEEVIGLIVQADEGAFQTAHAAGQADAVLALLMHLHGEIDRAILFVQLALGIVLGFQGVKVIELVQAKNAELPQAAVEDMAFLHQQFATDHAVARSRVALELNAADEEWLAFFGFDIERDQLLFVVEFGVGNRGGECHEDRACDQV